MPSEMSQASRLPSTRVWTIDPRHSSVQFVVTHNAVSTFRASFSDFEGRYDAVAGTLRGSVAADSVQLSFDKLREALVSPQFFDAERYPVISFTSSDVKADGDALTIDGEMTMMDVTKPIRATGTISGMSKVGHPDGSIHDHFGMDLQAAIDRRDFGVAFNNELFDGQLNLGWTVKLDFALELSAPVEDQR